MLAALTPEMKRATRVVTVVGLLALCMCPAVLSAQDPPAPSWTHTSAGRSTPSTTRSTSGCSRPARACPSSCYETEPVGC